jgi:hypothetical protein
MTPSFQAAITTAAHGRVGKEQFEQTHNIIKCYPMFESDDYHCEFSPSNKPKKDSTKNIGVNKIL